MKRQPMATRNKQPSLYTGLIPTTNEKRLIAYKVRRNQHRVQQLIKATLAAVDPYQQPE